MNDNNYYQVENKNYRDVGIKGNFEKNCLNDLFFSQTNIDALQTGLRNLVSNKTQGKHTINNQSETELMIIMRSIYLEYGMNLQTNVIEQIRDLNKKVLDFSVPRILVDLEQYDQYIVDASQLHIPMDRSSNVSNKGNKVLFRKDLF
jgi:hypothetical protein|tara:strand:+ start:5642 stop:6082 length:441 start_codon:yes stop_codon:yes gene_type:complete